jgi:hypothetical protein
MNIVITKYYQKQEYPLEPGAFDTDLESYPDTSTVGVEDNHVGVMDLHNSKNLGHVNASEETQRVDSKIVEYRSSKKHLLRTSKLHGNNQQNPTRIEAIRFEQDLSEKHSDIYSSEIDAGRPGWENQNVADKKIEVLTQEGYPYPKNAGNFAKFYNDMPELENEDQLPRRVIFSNTVPRVNPEFHGITIPYGQSHITHDDESIRKSKKILSPLFLTDFSSDVPKSSKDRADHLEAMPRKLVSGDENINKNSFARSGTDLGANDGIRTVHGVPVRLARMPEVLEGRGLDSIMLPRESINDSQHEEEPQSPRSAQNSEDIISHIKSIVGTKHRLNDDLDYTPEQLLRMSYFDLQNEARYKTTSSGIPHQPQTFTEPPVSSVNEASEPAYILAVRAHVGGTLSETDLISACAFLTPEQRAEVGTLYKQLQDDVTDRSTALLAKKIALADRLEEQISQMAAQVLEHQRNTEAGLRNLRRTGNQMIQQGDTVSPQKGKMKVREREI